MIRFEEGLRVTHKNGLSVTVSRERSWHKSLQRALRILRARLYARQKGLRALGKNEIADMELNEIHRGEFVGVVQVDGVQYSISEAAKEQFEPGEHWAKRSAM